MKQDGATLAFLKEFEKMGIPAMDCCVFQKGKCVFRYMSGFSDEAKTRKIDGSERYNLYSCSKFLTCTAVMLLAEKDLLRLDDPVYEFLPEFREMKKITDGRLEEVKNVMTVRHLMTMTAGLTYNLASENLKRGRLETNGKMPTREAMKYLAEDPLVFEPGSFWQYSLCHDVLAAIVEAVSGKRFGLFVRENIFDPAGMKRSTFLLPDEELSQIAAQYIFDTKSGQYNPCGPKIQSFKLGTEYESGGAGGVSTTDDFIAFLEALRTGKLLGSKSIARMASPQLSRVSEKIYCSYFPGYSYGLGIRCPKPGGDTRDYGWDGAAGAHMGIIPSLDVSFYYAQHVLSSPNHELRKALPKMIEKDL